MMRKCMCILLGCMLTAIGLIVLKHTHAVTGGTAGLALSLSYVLHFPFVTAFLALNIPFFLFSAMTMGWRFTLYSIGSVITLTLMTTLVDHMLPPFGHRRRCLRRRQYRIWRQLAVHERLLAGWGANSRTLPAA